MHYFFEVHNGKDYLRKRKGGRSPNALFREKGGQNDELRYIINV